MSGLELSLQVLVVLEGLPHFFVDEELVWDLEWNQEFGGVSSSLELWLFGDQPVDKMLNSLLLSVDNIPLERWVVVTWVSQHLEVAADSLLSFILGLSLDIN